MMNENISDPHVAFHLIYGDIKFWVFCLASPSNSKPCSCKWTLNLFLLTSRLQCALKAVELYNSSEWFVDFLPWVWPFRQRRGFPYLTGEGSTREEDWKKQFHLLNLAFHVNISQRYWRKRQEIPHYLSLSIRSLPKKLSLVLVFFCFYSLEISLFLKPKPWSHLLKETWYLMTSYILRKSVLSTSV